MKKAFTEYAKAAPASQDTNTSAQAANEAADASKTAAAAAEKEASRMAAEKEASRMAAEMEARMSPRKAPEETEEAEEASRKAAECVSSQTLEAPDLISPISSVRESSFVESAEILTGFVAV